METGTEYNIHMEDTQNRNPNEGMLPVMTPEERQDYMEMLADEAEQNEAPLKMSTLDGFEDCLLYYTEDDDGSQHAVYCYEDMVESFARKNNTTYTEAVEFIDFNVMRTIPYMYKVGDTPTAIPVITHRINRGFTTLADSYFEKDYSDE